MPKVSIRPAGDFGERLVALLEKAGQPRRGAGAYLAKRYKVSTVTANDWLNGKFKPEPEIARRIAEDHGGMFLLLYFGKRPGYGDQSQGDQSTESSTETALSVHKPESASEIPAGYVRFPLLDGFVAAGEGGYVADYPEVVRELDLAEEWVRRNIAAPAERVRVITAQGDSMAPDISSGDVLFVDSGVTWFDADAIYVMNWRGRPIVKRLQMRRDGSLLIRSSNAAYGEEVVPVSEVDQLYISGRVVGVWAFRKY